LLHLLNSCKTKESKSIAVTFFLLFLYCESNLWTNSFQQTTSLESTQAIFQTVEIVGVICLVISLIFFGISILLKRIKNRKIAIYNLAKLLREVIENENRNFETEKLSYFNLLDSMRRDLDKPQPNPVNSKWRIFNNYLMQRVQWAQLSKPIMSHNFFMK